MAELDFFVKLPNGKNIQMLVPATSLVRDVITRLVAQRVLSSDQFSLYSGSQRLAPDLALLDLTTQQMDQLRIVAEVQQPIQRPRNPRRPVEVRDSVADNFLYAYEHNPEAFIPYSHIYIECYLNNKPIQAMLDTGAQASLLPLSVAKECNVEYLIDTNVRKNLVGFGTQLARGQIHALALKVGNTVFVNSFAVADVGQCILGTDWMAWNHATIDLEENVLMLGAERVPLQRHDV